MKALKAAFIAVCCLVAGCSIFNLAVPAELPANWQVLELYKPTVLRQSTSSEVLARFQAPDYGLLSQSKSIIVLYGDNKGGKKIWFNMVTFDENELLAKRKYVFISDERPKQMLPDLWEAVEFRCQMVIPQEVLNEPYANENARRIAILKKVDEYARKDTGEVGTDNAKVTLGGMVIGQGMEALLLKLDSSPVYASRLGEPNGVEFSHISYGTGRLRLIMDNDIAHVKMRLGSFGKEKETVYDYIGPMS